MRREDTPAWMQVVERRLEQAAEDARSRPAQAGIQWFRPSIPACKQAGMTTLTRWVARIWESRSACKHPAGAFPGFRPAPE